jgi:hypothetical protein
MSRREQFPVFWMRAAMFTSIRQQGFLSRVDRWQRGGRFHANSLDGGKVHKPF